MSKAVCDICPHGCVIAEGERGFCGSRANQGGRVVSLTYAKVSAINLDPIEKKPLRRFYPGSSILSVGATGCNLRCPFCQNHEIAQNCENVPCREIQPDALIKMALSLRDHGNIGLAFTYNEPLIGYEYVRDCAMLAQAQGLKTVLVTNGMINREPLSALLPYIDAMNIDLKGFTPAFYDGVRGDLEAIKSTIELSQAHCHTEVTTLLIPGENDDPSDMEQQAIWLSSLRSDIPLHLTRFYPRYKYAGREPTPQKTPHELARIARKWLLYVSGQTHEGNKWNDIFFFFSEKRKRSKKKSYSHQ